MKGNASETVVGFVVIEYGVVIEYEESSKEMGRGCTLSLIH